MNPPTAREGQRVLLAILLGTIVAIPLAILAIPLYVAWRVALRVVLEITRLATGKRMLVVYSASPIWQERIERVWLPRLGRQALVVNWSEGDAGQPPASAMSSLWKLWTPPRNEQPVVIWFPGVLRSRQLSFYEAFRDSRQGSGRTLENAEEELFALAAGRDAEGASRPVVR